MVAAEQTAMRLVGALEDLAGQEQVALHAGDYEGLRAIANRAEPLVAELVRLAASVRSDWRPRVEALMVRRERHLAELAVRLRDTGDELDRLRNGRKNLLRIAPVYGQSASRTGAAWLAGRA